MRHDRADPGAPSSRPLDLPDAPPIRGLRFRLYEGPEELPAMVEVCRAANQANGLTEAVTLGAMTHDYASLTNSDPRDDCLLVEVDGHLVAYSRVEWIDNTDGSRSYHCDGFVHPRWRRRGLGRAMLHHGERRLAEIAAGHAFEGPRWLTSMAEQGDAGARALLVVEGYGIARLYHHMVRPDLEPIDLPDLPAGLEVRPVGRRDLRRLFEAEREAFRDHFGGEDFSEAAFRRWSLDPRTDPDLFVVAFDGEEVAGAVHCVIDAVENQGAGYLRGWLDPIYTRRPWRRRGLAQGLIGRALVLLRERDMTSAQLYVDSENPNQALGLYERHGFVVDRSSTEWRKPLVVPAPMAVGRRGEVPVDPGA